MKEIILVLVLIVMLTGVVHTLRYSNFLKNFGIGIVFFLGVFGLFTMYDSIRYKDKTKRFLALFLGFLSVLIAYVTLEGLLRQMGR